MLWSDLPQDQHMVGWLVECCFTSTETVGLFGTGAQDGHLDFHAAPERLGQNSTMLYVHRNRRLIRDGSPAQDGQHLYSQPSTIIITITFYQGRLREQAVAYRYLD